MADSYSMQVDGTGSHYTEKKFFSVLQVPIQLIFVVRTIPTNRGKLGF